MTSFAERLSKLLDVCKNIVLKVPFKEEIKEALIDPFDRFCRVFDSLGKTEKVESVFKKTFEDLYIEGRESLIGGVGSAVRWIRSSGTRIIYATENPRFEGRIFLPLSIFYQRAEKFDRENEKTSGDITTTLSEELLLYFLGVVDIFVKPEDRRSFLNVVAELNATVKVPIMTASSVSPPSKEGSSASSSSSGTPENPLGAILGAFADTLKGIAANADHYKEPSPAVFTDLMQQMFNNPGMKKVMDPEMSKVFSDMSSPEKMLSQMSSMLGGLPSRPDVAKSSNPEEKSVPKTEPPKSDAKTPQDTSTSVDGKTKTVPPEVPKDK